MMQVARMGRHGAVERRQKVKTNLLLVDGGAEHGAQEVHVGGDRGAVEPFQQGGHGARGREGVKRGLSPQEGGCDVG